MRLSFLLALALGLAAATAQAQRPPQENIDASKLPESGPLVTGTSGVTAGPNSKNQAVTPMPGLRDVELSESPATATRPESPPPQPLPGSPVRKPPVTPAPTR
jgi:hypothetical protein